jgi:hypothetical protein
LLHENASSHKAAIAREYLTLPRVTFSYFRSSNIILLEENIKQEKNLGSSIFQCLNSIPRKYNKDAFKN